jgi:hypothetical protein
MPQSANPTAKSVDKNALIPRAQLSNVGVNSPHSAKLEAAMQELGIVPLQNAPSGFHPESLAVGMAKPPTQQLPDWSHPFMRKVILSHIDSGSSPFSTEMRSRLGHAGQMSTKFDRSELKNFIETSLKYSGLFDTATVSNDRTVLMQSNTEQSKDSSSISPVTMSIILERQSRRRKLQALSEMIRLFPF